MPRNITEEEKVSHRCRPSVDRIFLYSQATAARAEADDARRRVEAERGAMEIRAATLAPEVRALEESRAALEGLQRGGTAVLLFVLLAIVSWVG